MQDASGTFKREIGALSYVLFLLRGPIIVAIAMVIILVDFVIPGSMKEALRFALLSRSQWYQFAVIGVALLLACGAVRFSGEAIVELVAPELRHGAASRLAHLIPRLLALSLGLAVAVPLIQIVMDWELLKNSLVDSANADTAVSAFRAATKSFGLPGGPMMAARLFAAIMAGLYIAIAVFVAIVARGPHTAAFETRDPSLFTRIGFALFPLALAAMFAVAVMGSARPGIAYNALERYSTAVIGVFSDEGKANQENELWVWVHGSGDPDRAKRYAPYIKQNATSMRADESVPQVFVSAKYSVTYVLAMLLSLFAACYASRFAVAAFIDLLFPTLGRGGWGARLIRRLLPPLASTGLGVAVALRFGYDYFFGPKPVALQSDEIPLAWIILAVYVLIGVAASVGSGSKFADAGTWRASPSIGGRLFGSARRLAALDPLWHWFVRGLLIFGAVIFFVFANLSWVAVPQWIGPVGIILLWGATSTAALFFLSYLGHATRIPFVSIIIVAVLVFAGFNINDNHGLRILGDVTDTPPADNPTEVARTGRTFELAKWLATRPDRGNYAHYPVFLVATEGGGARAAYFTATVLAALQERCPAFAQHTIAISGVSGGSLGASVFAALAADNSKRSDKPDCRLEGASIAALRKSGQRAMVEKARQTLSTDLLSPLLGAMLFPDTVQRALPFPVPSFDRARALEYAVEDAWQNASTKWGGDSTRLMSNPEDLYRDDNSVPNLILNTTETGTGKIVPYLTAGIPDPRFRELAQIDDGNLDCGWPINPTNCVMPVQRADRLWAGKSRGAVIRLSTAAILSARFPYLTPAGSLMHPETGAYLDPHDNGHYVDGGYFENSGTFMLSTLLQSLVGEQMCLSKGESCKLVDTTGLDKATLTAAQNAVFIVIIIRSEPCPRHATGTSCESTPVDSSTWSELLSPLRALLSTRDSRATYSSEALLSTAALIEQLSAGKNSQPSDAGDDVSCADVVCTVTLRFLNRTNTDIPLTWVLSKAARRYMDVAVDGLESADVRTVPPDSITDTLDRHDTNRVLGTYRRVLCLLATRGAACTPRPLSLAAN